MSGMKGTYGLCMVLVVSAQTGCQATQTNPAFSSSAFGGVDTATLRFATGRDRMTYFLAFGLEKCPNPTYEKMGYLSNAKGSAEVKIRADRRFYLVVKDGNCSDSASFVPSKDAVYLARFSYPHDYSCRVEIFKTTVEEAPETPEPTFINFTRINVYGLTSSSMCPQVPK